MGKFKGFKTLVRPSYSVITPQAGFPYEVRGMSVGETAQLRASNIGTTKIWGVINKVIWNCITDAPEVVSDYDSFLENTTIRDRESLLYAVDHATYGDKKQYTVTCSECKHEQNVHTTFGEMFSMNPYPGSETIKDSYRVIKVRDKDAYDPNIEDSSKRKKYIPEGMPYDIAIQQFDKEYVDKVFKEREEKQNETSENVESDKKSTRGRKKKTTKEEIDENIETILTKRLSIKCENSNVYAMIKQPTIKDEAEIAKRVPHLNDEELFDLLESLIIDTFQEFNEDGKCIGYYDDKIDIYEGYKTLNDIDKKNIRDAYFEEFGKYQIKLTLKWDCVNCGKNNERGVDLIEDLFRMVWK